MSLSVCLLLDAPADRAVRRLWLQLEADGVRTLATHTHGRHVPHVTLASLRSFDLAVVRSALLSLPAADVTDCHLDALGMFRRSRCWLAPAVTDGLLLRQEAVVTAVARTGADLHPHYRPGTWVPHLTLAPRLQLDQLAVVAKRAFEVLPLQARLTRAALVDTGTGEVLVLPHLV